MKMNTRQLWDLQNRHPGDRLRLFRAVQAERSIRRALYPGSYVDVALSFVFQDVVYADMDRRAGQFFSDREGVAGIIAGQHAAPANPSFRFIQADYNEDLGLTEESFDLLVSLYAGFVSEACTQYLRVGGLLLVNGSHGDAAMAAIDPRYQLMGVVAPSRGGYRVKTSGLQDYLVPKRRTEITREILRETGRGIAYTKPSSAYLFERIE